MSVQELEAAVSQLSRAELKSFSDWFEEFLEDAWDRQIEADILAGKFDAAAERAIADLKAGRTAPL